MKQQLSILSAVIILLLASCSKDDTAPKQPDITPANGLYVTSDGTFEGDGSLSYYDFATQQVAPDFYGNQNNTATLGNFVNDMIIYGSKMYIVVNGSSTVVVADKYTAKNIKTIYFTSDGTKNGTEFQPRFITAQGKNVFVTSSDGYVSAVDTNTLAITKRIKVGSTPEGIIVSGNNLYVANSGWKDVPWGSTTGFDSTVSVIDINSLTEIKKIKTGINGLGFAINSDGSIYEATLGNTGYQGSVSGKIYIIKNNQLQDSINIATSGKLSIFNNNAYVFNYDYNTSKATVSVINLSTKSINNFITDGTIVQYPYGLNIDESNGDVYVTDAVDNTDPGKVFCFDKTGKKKFDFSVAPAVFPNKVVFLR